MNNFAKRKVGLRNVVQLVAHSDGLNTFKPSHLFDALELYGALQMPKL
jgi:hypothetical protein